MILIRKCKWLLLAHFCFVQHIGYGSFFEINRVHLAFEQKNFTRKPCHRKHSFADFSLNMLLQNMLSGLLRFAHAGVVGMKNGLLKLPPNFSENHFYHLAKESGLERHILGMTGHEQVPFTELCSAFLQKGYFSAWKRVLKASYNLEVLINPLEGLAKNILSPSRCYLLLHEVFPGEVAKETVVYVNGIRHSLDSAIYEGWCLSQFCSVNVLLVYNASVPGIVRNLTRAFFNAQSILPRKAMPAIDNLNNALQLVLVLNRFEPSMLFAHSDGTSLSYLVLERSGWKRARHFHYFSAGPAKVLESRGFLAALQVASRRDPIPHLIGEKQGSMHAYLSLVPASNHAPLFDHTFLSPTYFRQVEKFVENFRGLSYE